MEQVREAAEDAASNMLFEKVPEEIQHYRYSVCKSCDKLYKPTDTCKVCGCFMRVKTWMPNQSCPIGNWPKLEK